MNTMMYSRDTLSIERCENNRKLKRPNGNWIWGNWIVASEMD